jgi:hypothetical protein
MIIKITNKIEFQDDPSGLLSSASRNSGQLDWTYDGDSKQNTAEPEVGEVVKDFKISNANKFVYELKHGNGFDVNIQQDIIRSFDPIVSLHVFCYETTESKPYRLPVRFDVVLDEADVVLASTCDFSLGNMKNMSNDIRISNVQVPLETKANLVIIVATKSFES